MRTALYISVICVSMFAMACTVHLTGADVISGMALQRNDIGVSFFPKPKPLKVAIVLPGSVALAREKSPVPNKFEYGLVGFESDRFTFVTTEDKVQALVYASKQNVMYLYNQMKRSEMFVEVSMLEASPESLDRVSPDESSAFDVLVTVAREQPTLTNYSNWPVQVYRVSLSGANPSSSVSGRFVFSASPRGDPMLQLEEIRGAITGFYDSATKPR